MNSIQLDSLKMSLGLDPDQDIPEAQLRRLWVEQHLQESGSPPASPSAQVFEHRQHGAQRRRAQQSAALR